MPREKISERKGRAGVPHSDFTGNDGGARMEIL